MTDTNSVTKLCPKAEILKGIRNFKGTIFIRGACFLATATDDDRGYNDLSACIPVSRKQATKYVNDIISKVFEDRGARMRVTVSSGYVSCMFIGQ